jgi:hypothetical protein
MQNSKKKICATVKFRLLMERIRRPGAEITDYFKLVYQSCFGLAHIIENEELFFRYLCDELNDVKPSSELPLVEPITIFEPMARLHLQRFVFEGLNADRLYNACLTSLNTFKMGEKTHFALVADMLIAILHDRPFLFPSDEIHRVIDAYPFETCPPFHHSPAYHTLYAPHYRLVDPEWIGSHRMMC